MDSEGLTLKNTGGFPYGGIKIGEVPFFHQFRKYYRTNYPEKGYPGDLLFNIYLYDLYEKYNKLGDHIYISSVFNFLDRYILGWQFNLLTYYRGFNYDTVVSSKGERKGKIVFFNRLKKIWTDNSKIPITDFELNEFITKKLSIDKNFNLEDYLKHKNSNKIMSNSEIIIPNSGGITIPKVKNFSNFKILYMYIEPPQSELTRFGWHYGVHNGSGFGSHYTGMFADGLPRGLPYPGDYSFNVFLYKFINEPKRTPPYYYDFEKYLLDGGTIPRIKQKSQDDTIPNPRGGKVLKVAFFDELKTVWNRYDHKKSYTDFELNEKLSQLLRTPNFNLESYLKSESKQWETFKDRFPKAELNDFTGEHQDGNYNINYKDTPIEILGDHPVSKFNDSVRKSLNLYNAFPMSLQTILKNKYPIPGTDYDSQPPHILNEFEITVSSDKSFHAKFRNIFKETTVHFHSARQCIRWKHGPNFNYWPQQLNWAVWCATSGCGISLNEDYPKRIQEFINFHVYFTIRRLLWELKVPLPGDSFFHQTNNHFNKIDYQRLCQEFNLDENTDFRFRGGKNQGLGTIHVNGWIPPVGSGLVDWPNQTPIFSDRPGVGYVAGEIFNLAHKGRQYDWFTPEKGLGLTKGGLGRLNRSVEAFVYCIVGAEVNMRSSIVDSGEGQNVQKEMINLFENSVVEEDLSKSVQRYQLAVQEAKLKLNFAIAPNIWLMPTDMIINTQSLVNYNNFLVKAKPDMTFGENKLINSEIKKVGLDHNLGSFKTILPHIVEKNDHIEQVVSDNHSDDESETDTFTRISSKPQILSHDLNKTIVIIISGFVSYMIFR